MFFVFDAQAGRLKYLSVMPSRFVDLGNANEDAIKVASEIATDTAYAVGESIRGVHDWATRGKLLDALPMNMSRIAQEAVQHVTTAFARTTSQFSHTERRMLEICACLLGAGCVVLVIRNLIIRRRANCMVNAHLKLD